MTRMMTLWRARPWLTSAFLLACAVTLFFAARLVFFTVYWATHREMPVEPWMTVGYVARSWGLDPRELDAAAGLPVPEVKGRPQPLAEIARDRGVPVAEVIADVEAALADLRAQEAAQ
ncbi:MAG: hypothetical protein MUE83_09355 [Tabrizicola sp.]|jgi:hypothetical protein|nr:hypothetical protein [Tabrizicola sp.]